jgi:hypothetical protein
VTGDKQHFGKMKELDEYPFRVVTPSEFIASILPEILKGTRRKRLSGGLVILTHYGSK